MKVLNNEPEHAVHSNVPWYVAVWFGNHKYIRYLSAGEIEELYDLDADPEELTNLAARQDHAKKVAEMRMKLRRTDAEFADALPPVGQVPRLP